MDTGESLERVWEGGGDRLYVYMPEILKIYILKEIDVFNVFTKYNLFLRFLNLNIETCQYFSMPWGKDSKCLLFSFSFLALRKQKDCLDARLTFYSFPGVHLKCFWNEPGK